MSTTYYALKKPVTSLRVEERNGHVHLTIFINHTNIGKLTVLCEELLETIALFKSDVELLRSFYGKEGCVVESPHTPLSTLNKESQVIDEYGKLMTIGEVLGMRGNIAKAVT